MLSWLSRLRRRSDTHQPEVEEQRRQQQERFDVWDDAMTEVVRVEKLARRAHAAMHRPRPR
jgi:hypothetical protein